MNATLLLPGAVPSARAAVKDLGLDVLVYTDVGMDPFTSLLPYARLAPTQVSLWGHHGTSGLEAGDYFVVGDGFEGGEGWEAEMQKP